MTGPVAPGGLPVLTEEGIGRVGRRVLIGVVVVGLLVIAAGVVAFVRRDDIIAWADAPAVLEAHRSMQAMALPASLVDDPTLTACDPSAPVRCAWTDLDPASAVAALVDALRDAGLKPGPVVCDAEALPMLWAGGAPECGAPVELSGATAWAVATAETPDGGVPLGRTAAWVMWDATAMSPALQDRLVPELDWPAAEPGPSPAEVAALVPARYRFPVAADCAPDDDAAACYPAGVLDVSDLGADPVPALVAELTDAGLYVAIGKTTNAMTPVEAFRFYRDDDGQRRGLLVIVRRVDGELVGQVWPW